MTQLSVNVNKIALLRNARGRNFPDLLVFSGAFWTWAPPAFPCLLARTSAMRAGRMPA